MVRTFSTKDHPLLRSNRKANRQRRRSASDRRLERNGASFIAGRIPRKEYRQTKTEINFIREMVSAGSLQRCRQADRWKVLNGDAN